MSKVVKSSTGTSPLDVPVSMSLLVEPNEATLTLTGTDAAPAAAAAAAAADISSSTSTSATTTTTTTTAVQTPEPSPENSNNPDSINTTNTTTKPTEETQSPAVASKKRGRGRPKGSKNKKIKSNLSPEISPSPSPATLDTSNGTTAETPTETQEPIQKPIQKQKPKQIRYTFDQRLEQIKTFQQNHGHCNVPKSHDTSLSEWVKNMKYSYANKRLGKKSNMNLSQERITRLESIGNDNGDGNVNVNVNGNVNGNGISWKWTSTSHDERFNVYCDQLVQFKEENGHCHVPWNYTQSPGLGNWCNSIRAAYTNLHNKINSTASSTSTSTSTSTSNSTEKDKKISLSPERLQRLEEIGFDFCGKNQDEKFDKQCAALIKFKKDNGHCNVPQRYTANPSLGQFCTNMRVAYNCLLIKKKPKHNLSNERIERLQEIGLKWKVKDYEERFEKHCLALEEFKKKHGHCNVSKNFKEDSTLATWCHQIRFAYHQKKKGKKPGLCVSQDRIERLEAIGFKWFPNRP